MKLTITAAAALIGLATAFGPAGAAPVSNLPDGTQVIEVDGRDFGRHGGGRGYGGYRSGRYYGRHSGGHSGGHGHHQPYVYGGIALGTYLFLGALNYD